MLKLNPGLRALWILPVLSCRSVEDVCTRLPQGAIVATVRDSATGVPRVLGAKLHVRDGAYADSAVGSLPEQTFLASGFARLSNGATGDGRPGTYDVTVTAAGYETWQRSGVRVSSARCGVVSVNLLVRLRSL